MDFPLVFIGAVAAAFALRNPIKKAPVAFYVLAVAVSVLFIAAEFFPMPRAVWSALFLLVQKCMLALALFAVVMLIGVFSRDSRVGRWLRPIRAELSIIAWILSLGHMAVYLASYLPRLGGVNKGAVMISFVVALVLFALLLVLGVTSFNVVKKRMKKDTWKRVQMLAYPFFGLVYLHLMLMLLPPALHGGAAAQVSVAVYSVLFAAYALLRVRRAMIDRKAA
ncbi:hypothetical protein [Paraeggerthella sp.]|uniref:hypothetical protein n=1 Tax=Paraeggerthella sp. TaxID=2897350 RepID=UPI003AB3619C